MKCKDYNLSKYKEDIFGQVLLSYVETRTTQNIQQRVVDAIRKIIGDNRSKNWKLREVKNNFLVPLEINEYHKIHDSRSELIDALDMKILDKAMKKLDFRMRKILKMHFFEGHNMKDIGNKIGVTESRINQLIHLGVYELSRIMNANYIKEDI